MNKSQYFYRCVAFTRKDNKVSLVDIYAPNNTTDLEEWLGIVISLADGQHTQQEFYDYIKSRYQFPPQKLEDTLESVFDRLIDSKMIKISDNKIELPYYLASPIEDIDIEKAKTMIEKDGYTYK